MAALEVKRLNCICCWSMSCWDAAGNLPIVPNRPSARFPIKPLCPPFTSAMFQKSNTPGAVVQKQWFPWIPAPLAVQPSCWNPWWYSPPQNDIYIKSILIHSHMSICFSWPSDSKIILAMFSLFISNHLLNLNILSFDHIFSWCFPVRSSPVRFFPAISAIQHSTCSRSSTRCQRRSTLIIRFWLIVSASAAGGWAMNQDEDVRMSQKTIYL